MSHLLNHRHTLKKKKKKIFKCRYTHTHTLTSWTKRTCYFIIAPHQQKATNRCAPMCGALEECVRCFMFTWTCAVAEIQAGHIWKHCSPVAGFLRTAWRLACQTMRPYVTDSSQDQAGWLGTGHTRWSPCTSQSRHKFVRGTLEITLCTFNKPEEMI